MSFIKIACKYGLKTAFSDLECRIRRWWRSGAITWRNVRRWREWKRNANICPFCSLIIVVVTFLTVICFIPIFLSIVEYQHHYFQCPTIKRILTQEVQAKELTKINSTVTAYNAEIGQTDNDPLTMASGKKVYSGAIACPRQYPFGTKVEIKNKVYTCEDRMAMKYNDRFDIYMPEKTNAINWGKQYLEVIIY